MPIDPEKPFCNAKLTHDRRNMLLAMFQGISQTEPPLQGNALLQEIRDGKNALGFVHAIRTNLNLYNKIRDFLKLKGVMMVESEEARRRIARRVIATIWAGVECSAKRERAMSLLEGYRRSEFDVNFASPRKAIDASFAMMASEMETDQSDTNQPKEPETTQAHRI